MKADPGVVQGWAFAALVVPSVAIAAFVVAPAGHAAVFAAVGTGPFAAVTVAAL